MTSRKAAATTAPPTSRTVSSPPISRWSSRDSGLRASPPRKRPATSVKPRVLHITNMVLSDETSAKRP